MHKIYPSVWETWFSLILIISYFLPQWYSMVYTTFLLTFLTLPPPDTPICVYILEYDKLVSETLMRFIRGTDEREFLDENFNSLLAIFQTSCSVSKLQLEESVLPAHQRLLGSSTWGKNNIPPPCCFSIIFNTHCS